MSVFELHTIESAPEASKQMLTDSEKAYGFLPNLYRNMSEAPALLEGYLTLSKIFNTTSFTETERQIVLMTNNRLNGCTYCMAAHTTLSQMGGVADDVIEALRAGTPIADARLEALRQFSIVINETRGYPTDAQISAFLEAGFTKQNLLEILVGTSLKVLSNYTNHLAHTPLDAAFEPNVWNKD
ncbi:carboxymuconolactone decarboxylase family protein [Epibacterium sp. SM1969]|uniref:Carboxymuconolactone decarboxylase family protein n=1 Tax=Tritonibacter aquimaris TaxID=2663379 RepID=A0A844AVM0_9RHOB|nr:carboxymuconolactone decarboxylase family protein [Tritonibacter aquimaris]MQY43917.1 carboxymuconolactone decarboxylase family protein [Tritonibacter aquimaris]